MTLESILISDDNMNLASVAQQETLDDRKAQETVDFKMVTFSISGKDYAIDIMYVKEIAKAGQFTYVPNTLPFVVGVYNLRGEIIPILDLRIFFNISDKKDEDSKLQNLLILKVNEQTFGVIVDNIDKVVGIQKSSIQPSHPLFADINIKYIAGVIENNKHLYILLDVERIFSKSKDGEGDSKYEKRRNEIPSGEAVSLQAAPDAEEVEKAEIHSGKTEEPLNSEKLEARPENLENPESSEKICAEKKSVQGGGLSAEKSDLPGAENPARAEESGRQNDLPDENYKFVAEGLRQFGNFFVSPLNESWVKSRYEKWVQEKSGSSVQIQNAADAAEFLKPFWSSCTDSWWTDEYAENLFNLLPENTAKQIVVWNPGCGRGIETYCLACVLAKKYPESKIRLYAQDVDLLSVSNAPMLTVPEDSKPEWLSPFLVKTASGANSFNQQIKDSIMFEYHDCRNTNALPMVDLVFARDLVSFLDEDSQKLVLNDFSEKIKGNGSVVLGENEIISDSSEFLEHTEGTLTAFTKQ